MSVHSLKSYKEASALLPDIEHILKVLNLVDASLKHHIHYIPAYKVLCAARDQKKILEIYYKELLEVKKSKGKKV